MESYSQPDDYSVGLMPEPPVKLDSKGRPLGISAFKVLLRLCIFWKFVRRETLINLSGFSQITVERFIEHALKKGWIENLGRLDRGENEGIFEDIFGIGPRRVRDDFLPIPREKAQIYQPALHKKGFVITSKGMTFKPHPFLIVEGAASVAAFLRQTGIPFVIYPEHVLTRAFGWFSPREKFGLRNFCTEVSDSLLLFPDVSVRLEVQLTPKGAKHVTAICKVAEPGEMVLYITPDEGFYELLLELQKTKPNLMAARLWNEDDLLKAFGRLDVFAQVHSEPSRMRDHYGKDGFIYRMTTPLTHLMVVRVTLYFAMGRCGGE
jgi:hypothetical protein